MGRETGSQWGGPPGLPSSLPHAARKAGGPTSAAGTPARPTPESGFALLLVFLMAAIVAIMLYSEVPRVAFQSQRHQEQLLMERGNQYMRAIQVYNQTTKGGWPRNIDDIETFQSRHFLRHKYIDPMTGKDEWRLIHTSGMGMLTDSLVTQNPATTQKSASSQSNYISEYAGVGQTLNPDQSQRQAGPARRPSEGGGGDLPPMMPGPFDQSGQPPLPGSASDPTNSAANTPNQGATGAQSGAPGTTPTGGQTTAQIGGQMPGQPGQNAPGMPGLPGQAGNPALSMINGILTSPNPQGSPMGTSGGPFGSNGTGTSGGPFGGNGTGTMGSAFGSSTPTTIGGGLAGVASKSEYEGIMEYNTQTLYKKWEFVFDPSKTPAIGNPGGSPPGTPVNQMGAQQTQQSPLSSAFGGANNQQGSMPGGGPSQPGRGTPNSPAGMQTGAASGALPPGFRLGRP